MSSYNIQIENTADQELLSRSHDLQCLLASFWTQQTGTKYLTECESWTQQTGIEGDWICSAEQIQCTLLGDAQLVYNACVVLAVSTLIYANTR